VVTWLARRELAGGWEVRDGLLQLAPLAWLAVSPAVVAGAILLWLCESEAAASRRTAALLVGGFGAAVGWGVSRGRHFAQWPVRAAFVAALGAVGLAIGYALVPAMRRVVGRWPARAALGAAVLATLAELANHSILPRLYPAFHLGLAAVTALTAPVVGRGLLVVLQMGPGRERGLPKLAPLVGALALVACAGAAPTLARRLALADNLRLIFLDRGPLMAMGVELGAVLAPPPPMDIAASSADEAGPEERLVVDWRGRDVLLISVDALRADHVGAYGYGRSTTPHIDALAREGALFLRAYCPTPHTSYSVTSMMTGKNLRPLIVQGLGKDSDTFAAMLRTYGYRTAAFYPPAVFFIDQELFATFEERHLDFEYARVEFADPGQRATAVEAYLQTQPADRSLFLWVHLFEPHEPYVAHPEHDFGTRDIDRYDSEIAIADEGIGQIVSAVRARRPNAVVILTADHGEEFGEHHGRYHGTTVFEEQVRVPLIVATPGLAPRRIEAPVQTIDILPTVLAALDVPRPPRIRGHNVGSELAGKVAPAAAKPEMAFSETDDQTLLADAQWRLICARRAGACALYNLDLDPGEARDVSAQNQERFNAMKASLRVIAAAQGRYEGGGALAEGGRPWPDPIRRGLAGDGEAVREIAALLDDSDVVFRRKAAEVLFDLKRKEGAPELRLALSRDEDDLVRRWCALSLTRLGEGAPRTIDLLDDPDPTWRRLAALALAENGDARGGSILVSWWQAEPPPYQRARDVLAALALIRAKDAAPVLLRSLDDVRLRPYVADTLAAIGQAAARGPLAERWGAERYQNSRVAIGAALVKLGAKYELVGPLTRFLGTPDPLPNGLDLAKRAGILRHVGGLSDEQLVHLRSLAARGALVKVMVPSGGNGSGRRVLVRARTNDGSTGQVRIGRRLEGLEPAKHHVPTEGDRNEIPLVELDPRGAVTLEFSGGTPSEASGTLPAEIAGDGIEARFVVLSSPNVILEALAVVPLADELAPPAPEPWAPH
jgi:arylsulfatase A-like enzyme